jgi:aminoglycoside phosphotransferase (APT) family kinase protein
VTPVIPSGYAAITPEWLTAVLRTSYPGVEVTSVAVADEIYGAAAKARLELTYAGPDYGLPATMIAKTGFVKPGGDDTILQDWHSLIHLMNECESRFYREVAPTVDMTRPACFASLADTHSGHTFILLEDLLARGARFGAFDQPLDADAMATVLNQLARLHASHWDDPGLTAARYVDGFADSGNAAAFLSRENWDEQLSRPRGARVPVELRDRDLVARGVFAAFAAKREGPRCIVHGDPHIGNVYFTSDGGAGLLDFQLFCEGRWAWDFGYSMTGAMTLEDRRTHERDLLAHYLGELRAAKVDAPSFDAAWFDYRRFAIWGFVAFLTPGEKIQSEEYNTVVGERHAVAAVDLESLTALGIR